MMARTLSEIEKEIAAFLPVDGYWRPLDDLLAEALGALKTAGYAELARSLWAGIASASASQAEAAALQRLTLDTPASVRDRLLRALVLGALRQE